jgi:amino acid adenylation domain-containing protein
VQLSPEEIERVVAAIPGGAANIQDIYPLTPLQEGLLFHHRMASEGDGYLLAYQFGFDSRDRLDAYLQALQAVIDRNDIMRTAVLWEGFLEPVQVVCRRAPLVAEEVNLDAADGDVARQLWARINIRNYRLEVREAPLMRVFIAHDAANGCWVMQQMIHHLIEDMPTMKIVQDEIYALLQDRGNELPPPVPFRNFVAQSRLGVPQEEHETFFRKLLGDVDEPTTPFGLSDVQGDGSGIQEGFSLVDAALARRLRETARAFGVSAATVFHLAWAQVLALVSARDDVVFGTVLLGRMQAGEGADRVLGPCINTLPIRIRVGDTSVQESVRHTHSLLAQLMRHENASLAVAQRCSAVAAPAPLFSSILNYRHSQGASQALARANKLSDSHDVPVWLFQDIAGREFLNFQARTNYPFELTVDDFGEGFRLDARVQSPLVPRRICACMHTALEQLVSALESAPNAPLRSVGVLPKAERDQLLHDQYADDAIWQRQWLEGETLEKQLGYWKEKLANLSVFELPSDHPRPALPSHKGAGEFMVLSKSLTDALKRLSRAEGVTLFMMLLAAFKILLQRHSGQDDISVGSPIANRNRAEIEPLIGFFLNTLVLRTDLSNNPSFREFLGRVREVCLGAYAHQDLPFEKLVEELHPQRDLNRHPLFDILFNFDDSVSPSVDLPGLILGPPELTEPLAKFSMTLYAGERQGQLYLRLVYQKALFSAERMRCFLEQFEYLLEQIVVHPERPIRDYSLVTLQSRSVLPDPTVILPEPQQELVTSLFTGWARRTPDQPAVSYGKHTWTYDELAREADILARLLVLKGVKRGEVVAVYGTRSFDLICSVMGVLSSGGVLLLIDRGLPAQRQKIMLRQAGVKILVHAGEREPEDRWLEQESDLTILSVGAANGRFLAQTSPDLANVCLPELVPDDAAYIFFTSGTTGVPKGVLGCHKGLTHFLAWQRETFAVGPDDRVAQLTNLSFDPVLRDIFLPLSSGATLCLPDDAESLGPDETLSWLEDERISILHTVPTLAQSWVSHGARASLKSMRWVFFAGEPLLDYVVRQWRTLLMESGGEVVNLYGPTETTLAKCFYRVPANVPPGVQPVGCPLPQTQALVLGESNQPCGIGELGEIVLRTPFRSLGYVNVSDEYRKRFVKNPFRDDARDLLYYTGDRGRYRPDGMLEILGRLDDQVKIRGVRIELGEVTAVLSRHPSVNECVVTARKDDEGQTCLVAYVVAANPDAVRPSDFRVFLSKQLPAAMIPSAFVFLARLPLTPNGKVDRRALPAPENNPERDGIFVAPRNPVEEKLAEIWKEILHIEGVGVHDNFFDLGGHSLLATRVISRVHNAFQVVCPLRNIFETPTIAGLAERIETVLWAAKQFQAPRSINMPKDHVEVEL